MKKENTSQGVVRSAEEIQARIRELNKLSDKLVEIAQIDPNFIDKYRRVDRAMRELKWVLGEDVSTREDI